MVFRTWEQNLRWFCRGGKGPFFPPAAWNSSNSDDPSWKVKLSIFKPNLSVFFSISDQKWTKTWNFGWHIFKSPQIYKQFQNLNRINDNLSNLRQKYTRKLSSLVNIKIMQKSWEKNVFLKGGYLKRLFTFRGFEGGYL